MKVALCASEVVPFAKTGGLADVCGALPVALESLGEEVIVVMPKYASLRSSGTALKTLNQDFDWTVIGDNVKVYFLKADMYLREGLYRSHLGDYPDNLRRFSYFCRKALELFKTLNIRLDIIHCHDWQTSLIPLYLKAYRSQYISKVERQPKTLLTIHNMAYQGIFAKEQMFETGLDSEYFSISGLEHCGRINLLKGGILYADLINTVSTTYGREAQTKEFGCGLEDILKSRDESLVGIINGVDYSVWNPQGDPHLFKNYSLDNLEDKKENKAKLQSTCGLTINKKLPLIGFVGSLVEQKGIDLILRSLPELCQMGVETIILGTGEQRYERALSDMARQYPKLIAFKPGFDDQLAHRIYAASDLFLVPSKFEPCGIGQLISFKYGTVPIVFKTGGLVDTVVDYRLDDHTGSGFVFTMYTEGALLLAIERALEVAADDGKWQGLLRRLMRLNFSWKESARQYVELYEQMKLAGHTTVR